MLRNFVIFSLLFVAIHADGKFAVLNAPSSLDFQGNDPVLGEEAGEIISAAVGGTVNGDSHWPCFTVVDPFKLPSQAVAVLIDGAPVDVTPAKYEYPVEGNGVHESLSLLVTDMNEAKVSTCHIDYTSKKTKSASKCFGSMASSDSTALPATKSLNANDEVDADFLKSVADLNAAIDNYLKQKDSKNVESKDVIVVRLSLAPLVNKYGAQSAEVAEAAGLIKNTLSKLPKALDNAFVVVISGTDESSKARSKREVLPANPKNEYNLAEYYDNNYPVIFNIILWFMVVFGLSLLAISYAIGSMDPGRDSIIYRMTSTRMKKDN